MYTNGSEMILGLRRERCHWCAVRGKLPAAFVSDIFLMSSASSTIVPPALMIATEVRHARVLPAFFNVNAQACVLVID